MYAPPPIYPPLPTTPLLIESTEGSQAEGDLDETVGGAAVCAPSSPLPAPELPVLTLLEGLIYLSQRLLWRLQARSSEDAPS